MSEESLEGSRQLLFPEAILGRVLWHVHVPRVNYETFSAAQSFAGRRLKQQLRRELMPVLIISWLAVFFGAIALATIYRSINIQTVIIIIVLFILLLIFYNFKYQNALYKKVFASGPYDNFTAYFGEKGMLLESDAYMQFLTWSIIEAVLPSEHDFLMLTRSSLLIIIPEADLRQVPNRDGMLSFVKGKIASAAEMQVSSRSGVG